MELECVKDYKYQVICCCPTVIWEDFGQFNLTYLTKTKERAQYVANREFHEIFSMIVDYSGGRDTVVVNYFNDKKLRFNLTVTEKEEEIEIEFNIYIVPFVIRDFSRIHIEKYHFKNYYEWIKNGAKPKDFVVCYGNLFEKIRDGDIVYRQENYIDIRKFEETFINIPIYIYNIQQFGFQDGCQIMIRNRFIKRKLQAITDVLNKHLNDDVINIIIGFVGNYNNK